MEVLAAMVIGTMILISALTIFDRAETTSNTVLRNLDNSRRPYEALQLIAEDLDKMITTDSDTSVIVVNRHIKSYAAAIMAIRVKYKDPTNKDQNYKEIFWQCNTDPEGDPNDIILYRSYEGIIPEDKLLDKNRENSEKNVYVPICDGVTYFRIEVITKKEEPEVAWVGGMPLGVILKISFAKPFKDDEGNYEVPESSIYSRTIAFDKSRKIKFDISEDDTSKGDTIKTKLNILGKTNSSSNGTDLPKK